MSIFRECILFSAYNQIISRGYQEHSSHFVNYGLHLPEPHTGRRKASLKTSHTQRKTTQIFYPPFPLLPSPPSHIRPTPKLNIETKHQNPVLKISQVVISKSLSHETQKSNGILKFTQAATGKREVYLNTPQEALHTFTPLCIHLLLPLKHRKTPL
jgi:hypothetical protein